MKFAAVIGLTVVSGTVQYKVLTGMSRGTPPNPAFIGKMAKAGFFFAVASAVLAVVAFSS